jgi:hypothetical protein
MTGMSRRELLLTIAIATGACRAKPRSAEVTLIITGMI